MIGSCGIPDYPNDLNALADARNQIITTKELRVKWVNTLRSIVDRRTPRNHIGTPMTTDVDLLFATPEELAEALLRTLNLWNP